MTAFKNYEIFRNNVESAMRAKKIRSQAALAEIAKVSKTSLNQWMQGKSTPSGSSLKKIADALGVSVDALLASGKPIEAKPVDLSKEVFIEIKGKVWATPFRISQEKGTGKYIKARPGEQECYALEVEGSSMEPMYLPGDLIICRPHSAKLSSYSDGDDSSFVPIERMMPYHNQDVVVLHNGETNLKRIQIERGRGPKYDIFMVAMNSQFPKVRLSMGDEWEIQAIVKRREKPDFVEFA